MNWKQREDFLQSLLWHIRSVMIAVVCFAIYAVLIFIGRGTVIAAFFFMVGVLAGILSLVTYIIVMEYVLMYVRMNLKEE